MSKGVYVIDCDTKMSQHKSWPTRRQNQNGKTKTKKDVGKTKMSVAVKMCNEKHLSTLLWGDK